MGGPRGAVSPARGAAGRVGYRPDVDGLRAIAVLAVVAYHAGLPGAGFVGVDVFFVISGFLITGLLLREPRVDFWGFYARRARRILPALAVVVASTFVAGALLLPATGVLQLGDSAIAGLLMVANLYVPSVTGGYFDGGTHLMPLMHLWSLGVEEQFYLLWPVVFALVPRRWLGVALGALCVASLVASELVTQEAAFYGAPFRLWELGAGGLLAYTGRVGRPFHGAAGLALLAIAIAIPSPVFPGIGAMPAVLGAVLVIYAGGAGLAGRFLSCRPLVFVGLVSYSLYLWHWPLLAIDRALRVGEPPLSVRLILCGAAFLLATMTYYLIERPARHARLQASRRHVVGAAGCLIFVLIAGIVVAKVPAEHRREFERWAEDLALDGSPLPAECVQDSSEPHRPPPAGCTVGEGPLTILWGDSHAMSWQPAVALNSARVLTLSRSACAPIVGFDTGESPDEMENCRASTAAAIALIRSGAAERVVLAARWPTVTNTLPKELQDIRGMATESGRQRRKATGLPNMLATLQAISPHVGEIVVMGPIPQLRAGISHCLLLDLNCTLSRREFEELRGDALDQLRALESQIPNLRVIDPSPFFCSAEECFLQRDGVYLYWDDDHISASAARAFRSRIDP